MNGWMDWRTDDNELWSPACLPAWMDVEVYGWMNGLKKPLALEVILIWKRILLRNKTLLWKYIDLSNAIPIITPGCLKISKNMNHPIHVTCLKVCQW